MKNEETELQAAEIEIFYRSKVAAKDRVQIKHSADAFKLFWEHWDKNKIQYIEQFKIMLLSRPLESVYIVDN
ncbi:MAG: hypothetical protein JXN62_09510 [Bacteroidales bacterium]|nr:hypothetical protein [Bacteroidales bacterium]